MKTNYVLIDHENVQPKVAEAMLAPMFKLLVFVGANQTKIGLDLAQLMVVKGEGSRFIKISGNGHNALDFHMVFYLGRLAALEPECYFHLISGDKGMDPLIDHLKQQGIKISRWDSLAAIDVFDKPLASLPDDERLSLVIEYLIKRGSQRPASMKTLVGSVGALFQPRLDEATTLQLLARLESEGIFFNANGKLFYGLPD
jgi:hypothetical protein